jgi:hypothetical protein
MLFFCCCFFLLLSMVSSENMNIRLSKECHTSAGPKGHVDTTIGEFVVLSCFRMTPRVAKIPHCTNQPPP